MDQSKGSLENFKGINKKTQKKVKWKGYLVLEESQSPEDKASDDIGVVDLILYCVSLGTYLLFLMS